MALVPVGGVQVSSYSNMLQKYITYLLLRHWGLGRTREWSVEEVVAVEDQDQRCRTIVDGCPVQTVRLLRNARTSLVTSFVRQLVLKNNVFRSVEYILII